MLHTADLHIGDSRNLPGYLDRQAKMLQEIARISTDKKIDLAVFAGDIYDAKNVLPRERDLFLEWLIEYDRLADKHDFHVVLMNGNHDEIEEGYTHLHGHKIMDSHSMWRRVSVVEGEPRVVGPFKDKVYVAALPSKRYQGDEINFTVSALRRALEPKLEKKGKKFEDFYFVAMVHEALVGSETETRYKIKKGPALDPGLGVTYWALGDIHKPFQRILDNAWYPGSPIQHEFGDVSQDRGVLLVDLDNPTDPEPVLLKGITPLVTVTEVPDEWPEDQIIRFEGSAQEIGETLFPNNVVGFKPVIDEEIRSVVDTSGDDLLDGLDAVMVEQQVPEEFQKEIVEEIRSVASTL